MSDSAERWVSVLVGVSVLILFGAKAISGFKAWLRAQIVEPQAKVSKKIDRVETQVHSNHGTSMADDVTGISIKVDRIDTKVDMLGTRFDDHLRFAHPPAPAVTVIRAEGAGP